MILLPRGEHLLLFWRSEVSASEILKDCNNIHQIYIFRISLYKFINKYILYLHMYPSRHIMPYYQIIYRPWNHETTSQTSRLESGPNTDKYGPGYFRILLCIAIWSLYFIRRKIQNGHTQSIHGNNRSRISPYLDGFLAMHRRSKGEFPLDFSLALATIFSPMTPFCLERS